MSEEKLEKEELGERPSLSSLARQADTAALQAWRATMDDGLGERLSLSSLVRNEDPDALDEDDYEVRRLLDQADILGLGGSFRGLEDDEIAALEPPFPPTAGIASAPDVGGGHSSLGDDGVATAAPSGPRGASHCSDAPANIRGVREKGLKAGLQKGREEGAEEDAEAPARRNPSSSSKEDIEALAKKLRSKQTKRAAKGQSKREEMDPKNSKSAQLADKTSKILSPPAMSATLDSGSPQKEDKDEDFIGLVNATEYLKKPSLEPILELPDFVMDVPPPAMSATLDPSFQDAPLDDVDAGSPSSSPGLRGDADPLLAEVMTPGDANHVLGSRIRRDSSAEYIEALEAKACELASTLIPDYADSFARKDQKYKTKKYRDKLMERATRKASEWEADDPSSIRLAGNTSKILSEFQDYLEVIESQSEVDSILEYQPIEIAAKTREERRGVVLTEWNWQDKFSYRPNYKRRSPTDQNLHIVDVPANGDEDSVGFPGDEKKRYRCAHPSLRSKKCKVEALWVIVFIVLIAAFIGITSSDHKEDVEQEYMDRVQGVKGRPVGGHSQQDVTAPGVDRPAPPQNTDTNVGTLPPSDVNISKQDEAAVQSNVVEKEIADGGQLNDTDWPIQSQNSETDAKSLPHHTVGLPANKAPNQNDASQKVSSTPKIEVEGTKTAMPMDEGSSTTLMPDLNGQGDVAPSKDEPTGDLTSTVVSATSAAPNATHNGAQDDAQQGGEEEAQQYQAFVKQYHLIRLDRSKGWKGIAYQGAYEFCRGKHRGICPFDVICPLGQGAPPVGGYVDGITEAWVPVSDTSNEWVNLGMEGMCVRYSSMHTHLPEWDVTGDDSERVTLQVMCCVGGDGSGDGMQSQNSEVEAETLPHRVVGLPAHEAPGQNGPAQNAPSTQDNEAEDGKTALLHQNIGLPANEGSPALTAPDDHGQGATAPLKVGVTGGSTSSFVGTTSAAAPNATPSNAAQVNAQKNEQGDAAPSNEEVAGETTSSVVGSVAAPNAAPDDEQQGLAYHKAIEKYHPDGYDRTTGWEGMTYREADDFCKGKNRSICPFDAVCPLGTGNLPFGGFLDGEKSWVPISDGSNDWVNLGKEWPCLKYSAMFVHPPEWGSTGKGGEGVTGHVMCCGAAYGAGPALIASSTPIPTPNPGMAMPSGSTTVKGLASSKVATENMSVVASENMVSPGTLEEDSTSASNLDNPSIIAKYAPKWYQRSDGIDDEWLGSSYTDAIVHCAQRNSTIPCPYEAYCPDGPGSTPLLGSRVGQREQEEVWAPIMDIPNGWVNVGPSSDSCKLYNSLHHHPPLWGLGGHHSAEVGLQFREGVAVDMSPHIMCCRKPAEGLGFVSQTSVPIERVPVANTKYEQDILDKKHPIWFSREHGYHGTTHEEASDFCANVGDMVLCPPEAYCPQGNTDPDRPLFLQKPAFEGEQWAPVATTSTSLNERWLLIGKIDGDSQNTCSTFGSVREMKPDGWDLDDEDPEMKQHVMCCLNPNHLLREITFAKRLDPTWLDESFGWKGGSHDDAMDFCKKLGAKLCPYTAYCPHGPGQPVIGGHPNDFNIEGEQWAPVHRNSNYWVMIGQKYGNSATTCMDNWELEGGEPSWGTSNERADLKKHIMCCDL